MHWIAIVNSLRADYFVESDLPLLKAYVGALAAADHSRAQLEAKGAVVDGKASAWNAVLERELRNVSTLATRLRLAPQSRLDRKVAGVHARPDAPPSWERGSKTNFYND